MRECGLTKAEIRCRFEEAGLFTWNKPAYACLATRVSAVQRLTEELLAHVEQAEGALFQLGFEDFRVRVFHDAARLQLTEKKFLRAMELKDEIRARLSPWFETVLLDLEARG